MGCTVPKNTPVKKIAGPPAFYVVADLNTGGGGGLQPPALVTVPTTPSARWHPQYSTVVESGGRVVSATDLMGLAGVTEGAAGAGPLVMTDLLNRKFWRFKGSEYLNILASLVANTMGLTVFLVGRHHRGNSSNTGGSTTSHFMAMGNVLQGSQVNTLGGVINTQIASVRPPYLQGASISGATDAANKAKMVLGSQLQVIGVNSRPTANGGQRLHINDFAANVAQTGVNSNVAGGEIGRNPFSPGASGGWATFDMYDMLVCVGVLSNAQSDAIAAALMAGWSIPTITDQLIIDGDSIHQPVTIGSEHSPSMIFSEPGSPYAMPASYRVVNLAVSGDQTSNLVTRRDQTNTMYANLLPGVNKAIVQIGRNNLGAGAQSGATTYTNIVGLLNTPTTGYLQRGWEVRQVINIATSGTLMTEMNNLRTALRSPTFLTDCLAGPGQTYDGKLAIIDVANYQINGQTIFEDAADAANTTIYLGDVTHLTAVGNFEQFKAEFAGI